MTGIGGFLQEFLYGYSGLRMTQRYVRIDPMLNKQLGGIVLHRLAWHGRRFTVSIGGSRTLVTLNSGPAMTVRVRGSRHVLSRGHPLVVRTRRPDLTRTADLARCRPATASSAVSGAIPLAAVDGSPATDWRPQATPANLVVPLGGRRTVGSATLLWGRQWPPAPAPNVPPPPGPVRTLRPVSYRLQASLDGTHWVTVALVRGAGSRIRDRLSFGPVHAAYMRLLVSATSHGDAPMLQELRLTR
jgi:hypothetical protein